MCGIAGLLGPLSAGRTLRDAIVPMTGAMTLRGPDAQQHWVDRERVALGHARLSVIDLSEAANQPFTSACGRYVMVYNGEVYNYRALRDQLRAAGKTFQTQSDTEVVIEAIAAWGATETARKLIGMFAIAVWDRESEVLTLIRDRLGIKPLCYGIVDQTLVFASDLNAVRQMPGFNATVNRDALALFARHSYVPAPYTMFDDVWKLQPGCIVTIAPDADYRALQPAPYWSARDVARDGRTVMASPGDYPALLDELDATLRTAVRDRLVADVPLGAFLSGGIDSSLVVALMQQEGSDAARTFSIGFDDPQYNEAPHAAAVAAHLGTNHTELYVTERDALDVIPKLPFMYDEPFADSSQIPTFIVSQLARSQVTVALSGDGGDELFGGYRRYALCESMWARVGRIPRPLRRAADALLQTLPEWLINTMSRPVARAAARFGRSGRPADMVRKVAALVNARDAVELYRYLVSFWSEPHSLVINGTEPSNTFVDGSAVLDGLPLYEQMMLLDSVTYLPDDILCKVDRASMAVSLEARVPLLDHRVFELAWQLPFSAKVDNGVSKRALRDVLYRYVPQTLIDRPKKGFSVPIGRWLTNELRDWAEDLLDPTRMASEGYLDAAQVTDIWREHTSGERNGQGRLWPVLMFQAWLRREAT
ncbi:MAG: asparagine synthase (glutamine-hydrolyzing) [Gammaproteobacteria bacterium]